MSAAPHSARARSQLIIDLKQRDYEVLPIREPDHPGRSVLYPELGCASQGDTRGEALDMIAEAISLFLDACIDGGEQPSLHSEAMAEMVAEYDADGSYQTVRASVRPLDWDEIIARCDGALAHNAEEVTALTERGGAFPNKNDLRRAAADYEAAIAIASNHAEAYRGRGYAHFNLGDFDSAIADYNPALRRDPYDGVAITALETAYIALWEHGRNA